MAATAALLIGCAPATPTPGPPLPTPPPVPEGWRTITSDHGDIVLAIPPDLIITDASGPIAGFRDATEMSDEVIVMFTGPDDVDQPARGERVIDWVERSNWVTAGRGETEVLDQREVLLPAGTTLVLTAEYRFEEFPRWTMLHVIATDRGFAMLQFDGVGPPPTELRNEIRLMSELAAIPH